jgi:hypothetical protein
MSPKSKMVSFRMTAEEYTSLRHACAVIGVRNVSELARAAMHRIIECQDGSNPAIQAQVLGLREKIANLTLEIDRLDRLVTSNTAPAVRAGNGATQRC